MTLAVSIAQGGANNVTMRNRIINGAMMIDQRNAGASLTVTTGAVFALDRWKFWANSGGGSGVNYTVQRSTTAPTGFSYSMLITQAAAASAPSGTAYNCFAQYIEGYNIADLNWGATAASAGQTAKPVTLSFWVRSSLTGTFGGSATNGDQSRSYPFNYTISSANTWEQKTLTIPGDTAGTWTTDNTLGLAIFWGLGVGSTYSGVATGAWQAATYLGATGSVNVVTTNGATVYITGVQLEAGTTATAFEQRLYGTELALCQRYYYKNLSPSTGVTIFGSGYVDGSTRAIFYSAFPVQMRSSPTLEFSAAGLFSYVTSVAAPTVTSVSAYRVNQNGLSFNLYCASGLTAGQGIFASDSGGSGAYVAATAEL